MSVADAKSQLAHNPYAGQPARVIHVTEHTPTERSLVLEYDAPRRPGTFLMVSVPGAGEVPISVSGFAPASVEITVRNAGAVTSQIWGSRRGDTLYVRGPYGHGFPMEDFAGRRLLLIAGGSAVAPLKSIVEDYLDTDRPRPEQVDIIVGFRSPRYVLFAHELKRWQKTFRVTTTVDNDEEYAWMGSIGFVVDFIKDVPTVGDETRVVLIGPPLMMTNSIRELARHGVREEHVWVSLERHMKCGVGKCGHCRIREKCVCLDGPVFNYIEAKQLID